MPAKPKVAPEALEAEFVVAAVLEVAGAPLVLLPLAAGDVFAVPVEAAEVLGPLPVVVGTVFPVVEAPVEAAPVAGPDEVVAGGGEADVRHD